MKIGKNIISHLYKSKKYNEVTYEYFKKRYNLDGNLLDLLKSNVYLIDGEVVWSGRLYDNYKETVITAIKENYDIDVEYKEIKQFDNLKIYKLQEVKQ